MVGFFFLGAALLAIGTFISSVTESQAVAAGICFVVMLVNFFLSSLAAYVSSAAGASFAAFTVIVVLIAVIIWLMTKSSGAAMGIGAVLEAALFAVYFTDSSRFEGLFAALIDKLSLFERFYTFVDGIFDVTAIVYFVSVTALFLFLSVQSMEKRRWSE